MGTMRTDNGEDLSAGEAEVLAVGRGFASEAAEAAAEVSTRLQVSELADNDAPSLEGSAEVPTSTVVSAACGSDRADADDLPAVGAATAASVAVSFRRVA